MKKWMRGFSLAEMSIVLVVLGLIAGFVIAGKSGGHAAELQLILAEKNKFSAATFSFQGKYTQLPGDLKDAYKHWGDVCGDDNSKENSGCNGDGNGKIDHANSLGEAVKAWEHLARSGMIQGTYDGTGKSDGKGAIIVSSTNSPRSAFPGGYWELSDASGDTSGDAPAGGLYLIFGSADNDTAFPGYTSLTRADALSIDAKKDDGRANTGSIRGNASGGCEDGTSPYNATGGDAGKTDCTLTFVLK